MKPSVNIVGEDRNAFVVLVACKKAARKEGWSTKKILDFTKEAMSGDYDHLLQTVMEYFKVK